jgi:GNAT superfamily N-acetyltransferase
VLRAGEKPTPAQTPDPRIRVRLVNKDDDAEVRLCSRIAMTGFHPPGHEFAESDYEMWARVVKHPRTRSLLASVETPEGLVPAGAGSIELHGEIACLFGLSTLHAFRKLGIQQSLIAARLNLAIDQGVKVATIGSRPGAGTERNVRRMGFQTAYTKVILAQPGPGLVPARG